MNSLADATVSALCYSLAGELCGARPERDAVRLNESVRFVLAQRGRMPDLLRPPIVAVTLWFGCESVLRRGRLFHRLPPRLRTSQIHAWKQSRFGVCRNLVRFYESLVVFGYASLALEESQ